MGANGYFSSTSPSHEVEISIKTLDKIYADQIKIFRSKIHEAGDARDNHLFCKWLKVFNSVDYSEKMARNCLLNLMLHQLNNDGHLSKPFTKIENCQRNLEKVLDELEAESAACGSSIHTNYETFRSHYVKRRPYLEEPGIVESLAKCEGPQNSLDYVQRRPHLLDSGSVEYQSKCRGPQNSIDYEKRRSYLEEPSSVECQAKCNGPQDSPNYLQYRPHLEEESDIVESQPKCKGPQSSLDSQITTLHKTIEENFTLKEQLADAHQEAAQLRKALLDALKTPLENSDGGNLPRRLFESLFSNLEEDSELLGVARQRDKDLSDLLSKQLEKKLEERETMITNHMKDMYSKSTQKLKEKYEHRLKIQTSAHREAIQFKKSLLTALKTPLEGFDEEDLTQHLFENLFQHLADDSEFSRALRQLDKTFSYSLNKHFEEKLEERENMIKNHVAETYSKSMQKLKEKYEQRLKNQNCVHREAVEFKKSLLDALKMPLKDFGEKDLTRHLFASLFKQLLDDTEFSDAVHQLDKDFSNLMSQQIETKLKERETAITKLMADNYSKCMQKLKEKNGNRLKALNWAQSLQLKMFKMICFSALRTVVINSKNKHENIILMLKALESEYRKKVDDLVF